MRETYTRKILVVDVSLRSHLKTPSFSARVGNFYGFNCIFFMFCLGFSNLDVSGHLKKWFWYKISHGGSFVSHVEYFGGVNVCVRLIWPYLRFRSCRVVRLFFVKTGAQHWLDMTWIGIWLEYQQEKEQIINIVFFKQWILCGFIRLPRRI